MALISLEQVVAQLRALYGPAASLNLADVLGSAIGIGIGGAAISATVRFGWPLPAGLAITFAITACAGIAALAVSSRLPAGHGQAAVPGVASVHVP